MSHEAREKVWGLLTEFLVWLIRCVNPSKDNVLSRRLHDVADEYDTRPTGQWRRD